MISSHDKNLSSRIAASLMERGLNVVQQIPKEINVEEFHNNPLNGLFSFPYLDFAFVRYEDEMLEVELDQKLKVFGFCDAGLFAVNSKDEIILIDDEENSELIASEIATFKKLFTMMVSLATQEKSVSKLEVERLTNFENPPNADFWCMIAHALYEEDTQTRHHLLTGLKDEKVAALS